MFKTRNKCRICLKIGKSLPSIYAPTQRCYLPAVIKNISGVHISKRKEPHAKICACCQRAVIQAEAIIKQCQETQQYLLYLKCELKRLKAVKALQKAKLPPAAVAVAEQQQTPENENGIAEEQAAQELPACGNDSSNTLPAVAEEPATGMSNETQMLEPTIINDDLPLYNKQTCLITTPLTAYNFQVELPDAMHTTSAYEQHNDTNALYVNKQHSDAHMPALNMQAANTNTADTNFQLTPGLAGAINGQLKQQASTSTASSTASTTTDLNLQYMQDNGLLELNDSSASAKKRSTDAAHAALQGLLALEWLTVRPISAVKSQHASNSTQAPVYTKPEITLEPVVAASASKKRHKVAASTQTEFSHEMAAFELEPQNNSLDFVMSAAQEEPTVNTLASNFDAELTNYEPAQLNLEEAHSAYAAAAANTNGYLTHLDAADALDYVTQLSLLNAQTTAEELSTIMTSCGNTLTNTSSTLSLATQMELLELPKHEDDVLDHVQENSVAMLMPNSSSSSSYTHEYLEAVTANRPVQISLAVPHVPVATSLVLTTPYMTSTTACIAPVSANGFTSTSELQHSNERQCITPISIIETCSESSLSSAEQKPQIQTQQQPQQLHYQKQAQPQSLYQEHKLEDLLAAQTYNSAPLLYCQHCDFKTSKRRQYITHQWSAHQLRDETPYQCDRCEARFRFRTWLQKHVQLKHRHTQIVKPLFKCHKCGRMLASEKRLDFHLERLHSEGSKSHTCPVAGCEQVFDRIFSLRRHVEIKHCAKQRFHCAECDKYFNLRENLRYHFEMVHQNAMKQCPHCAQKFRLQQKLDQHLESAECKDYRYSCNHCGRRFSALTGLRKHVTNIHGEGRSVVHITLTRTDDD